MRSQERRLEVKRQGREGMGRGREGSRLECRALQNCLQLHIAQRGKKRKPQTEQPTKVNLITVSRSSDKHSLSTYCMHSGGSILEHFTERKVEAQRVGVTAGVTQ